MERSVILDKNKEVVKGVSFAPSGLPVEVRVVCNKDLDSLIPSEITYYKKGSTKIKVITIENAAGCPVTSVTTLSKIIYDTRYLWGTMSAIFGFFVCLGGTYHFKRTVLMSTAIMSFIVLSDFLFYEINGLRKYPTTQTVWVALLLCALLSVIVSLVVRLAAHLHMAILGLICGLCFFNAFSVVIPSAGAYSVGLIMVPTACFIATYFINEQYAKLPNPNAPKPAKLPRLNTQ